MNEDAVDVCVCKEIAISASMSIIVIAFHVCVCLRDNAERAEVCVQPQCVGLVEQRVMK